jgi:hypothetical protein
VKRHHWGLVGFLTPILVPHLVAGPCFSAVKREFGDAVRSRNDVAMVNECLCKFLCNNLCCVILSQIELGIEAAFWNEKDEGCQEPRHTER